MDPRILSRSHVMSLLLVMFLATIVVSTVPAQTRPRPSITPVTKAVIQGRVVDFDSQQPIPFATVQIEGSGQSTSANEDGKYHLIVETEQSYRLKCSHIAYYSERVEVVAESLLTQQDFGLHSAVIELPGTVVYDRATDPAQRIILEAIARKKDILGKLHDYSFDAYTKLIVRDRKKPDSTNILLITETQVTSYWEQPDKYKEVITARRQSKNIKAENNLVTVGEILNFNKNRIEAGEMSIVSPTATDALDYYNYYLTDTTYIDSQRVFVLAIEPKNELETLFKGTIHIADSTFDVVAVDVGFTGLRSAFIKNPRYSQRYAQFQNEYWLPVEIRFGADVNLPVPVPGFPTEMAFTHVASLHNFSIEKGTPKGTFGEVVLEVAEEADDIDSVVWVNRQTIPLTETEAHGYTRIDSIESSPKPIGKQAAMALVAIPIVVLAMEDLFHFNRVEGPYLGLAGSFGKAIPKTTLFAKGGYAFGAEYWQYQGGFAVEPLEDWPLMFRGEYHDQMRHRSTLLHGTDGNMTLAALWNQTDPFDYYKEDGFSFGVQGKLLNKTRLGIGYNNFNQHSFGLSKDSLSSDFSFFGDKDSVRANTEIASGHLRSVTSDFTYDSRPRMKLKGKTRLLDESLFTQFSARLEHTTPKVLKSDFAYTRYSFSLVRKQRTLGMGVTTLFGYYGASDRPLPPQKYFTMDYSPIGLFNVWGMQTLGMHSFCGDRMGTVTARHSFGRRLFVKSGIPGIKKIPFDLSVHGGVFWSDFKHQADPDTAYGEVARRPYSELGFGLSNLTPFMSPLNLAITFTWQLSDYETNKFSLSWGIEF